ncbi:uncharacterized protein [Clytia hemisphaerica]|uniref:EGF-like domain-containing protein n=1 Tax=Clytia hemisphaerica TaxID=252671 RepID=A0A7M5XAR5_9CNID
MKLPVITLVTMVSTLTLGCNFTWHKYKETQYSSIKIKMEIFVHRFSNNYALAKITRQGDLNTRLLCAERCMSVLDCYSWIFNPVKSRCYIAKRVYGSMEFVFVDHFFLGKTFEIYETVNPCNTHLLCEHGSQCVPDFTTETYTCERCFAPYTGKHCNETGPPSPSDLSHEVKAGHNSTCRHIKLHYNIPDYEGLRPFVLHPWNDQRTIKMFCSGYETIITSLNATSILSVRDLTSTDFADGLDLTTGDINFRANSLFFDAILKQIDIDNIYFRCVQNITGHIHLKSSERQEHPLEYFANRISYNKGINMQDTNPLDTIPSNTALNNTWSSPDVATGFRRAFKDVIVLNDGRRMTFANGYQECLGQWGEYFQFSFT